MPYGRQRDFGLGAADGGKLAAVQNPHTGLMSHLFGSTRPEQKTMHPQPFCDAFSDPWAAMALLRASQQLQSHGSDAKLAKHSSRWDTH